MKKQPKSVPNDADLESADSICEEMQVETKKLLSVLKPIFKDSKKKYALWNREYNRILNIEFNGELLSRVPNIMSVSEAEDAFHFAEEILDSLHAIRRCLKKYKSDCVKEDRSISKYKVPNANEIRRGVK